MQEVMERMRMIAKTEDIPLLGVGPVAAMADEPTGYRPEDLLPGARSLVCFGIAVPKGVYLRAPFGTETVWRSQNIYYRRLDTLSLRFATLLEEMGEQAVPVFGCMPMVFKGRRMREVRGYLNQIKMGVATGVGIIGRNGMLLNSLYGARVMLGGVVTTSELPPFRNPEIDEPGCPDDCRICIEGCPAGAISENKGIDINGCLAYTARTPLVPRIRFLLLRFLNPRLAARLMNQTALDEHTLHVCSRCVADCPY